MEELVEMKSIRLEDMELVFEVWNKSDMSLRIHSIVVYKVLPKPRVKKRFFGLITTIKERERIGICIPIPYEEVPPAGNSHLRVPLKYIPEGRCIIKLSGYFIAGEKEVHYPTRICPKCGRNLSQLPDDIKHCLYCGNELA